VKVCVYSEGKEREGGYLEEYTWLCEENEAGWAGFWLERLVGLHSPTKSWRPNAMDSNALRERQREETEETGGTVSDISHRERLVCERDHPRGLQSGSIWNGAAVHDALPDDVEEVYEIKSVVVEGASDGVEDYERSASTFRQPLRCSLQGSPVSSSLNWPDPHTGPWTDQSVVPQWSWPPLCQTAL
jgi:hypothetical protein